MCGTGDAGSLRVWAPRLLILIALLACELGKLAADTLDTRPIVVFREDDIRTSWRVPFQGFDGMSALDYGKLKRIPITWGVITDKASLGWGLTWSELKDYVDKAGGELASHSCSHRELPDAEAYISELVNSRAAIEANVPGYNCTTFLLPGVWRGDALLDDPAKLDNAIGQALQANYAQSQGYLGRGWQVGSAYYKYGIWATWSIDYQDPTIEAVHSTLDTIAATPGLIFFITCHGVKEEAGGDTSSVRANVLRAVMDRLAELRDEGRVRLMTMHEAYHTALPDDLNHIVDPSFELPVPPATACTAWTLTRGAQIASQDAGAGLKCCIIPQNGSVSQYGLIVPPGRYRLRWKQRLQPGHTPPRDLRCYVENLSPTQSQYAVYGPQVYSDSAGVWEEKTLLMVVKERLPSLRVFLECYSPAAFAVDEVSLTKAPLDSAVSVSESSVSPSPGACLVSFRTPADPAVVYVDIRVGNRMHPVRNVAQEGTLLGRVPTAPGVRQTLTLPINWSQQNPGAFFSFFAVREDGSSAEPDLVNVCKDTTAPSMPQVAVRTEPDESISASLSSTDAESGVYQYRYAVGTTAGDCGITGWQYSTSPSVRLTSLPQDTPLYLSVQAQNSFGLWSEIGSARFVISTSVTSALQQPDGISVIVSGVVSAVFGDCMYIQERGKPRGIRVVGTQGHTEGQAVTVAGRMASVAGERVLMSQ